MPSTFVYVHVVFQLLCVVRVVTNLEFNYNTKPERIIYGEQNRIRGFRDDKDKDFILGGLVAVHGSAMGSARGRCGTSLVRSGPERIEAFLYALDLINSDPNLLPNITLGYDIRDTCVSENVALDESADFIFQGSEGLVDCSSCSEIAAGSNVTSTLTVSAVIGATTSQVSIAVASLLRLFTVPQVSYSSSSPILSNRDRYSYFYRTIPPDDQQAQAMIDLVIRFGWTYVSAIHTNNAYGEPGIDRFRQLADAAGICIDLDLGIDDQFTPNDYYNLASRVINESSPNVIVFFASFHRVIDFFEQFKIIQESSEKQRRFLWIASDSWAGSNFISDTYGKYIGSHLGFSPLSSVDPNYDDYFSRLTLSTNKRNPWFREYFEDYYDCTVNVSCAKNVSTVDHPNYIRRPVELVIDAVYSVSHALHNFLLDNCDLPVIYDHTSRTCKGQKRELNGLVLRDYLQNVSFTSHSGNYIVYDSFGNIEGRYIIRNLQMKSTCKNCSAQYEIVNVGDWDETRQTNLQLFQNVSIHFGVNETENQPLLTLESQCQLCEVGSIKQIVQSFCCGICIPCLGRNYTNTTASECSTCPQNMWGNNPLSGSNACKHIREAYLDPSDAWGIVLIIVAILGLITVVLVCIAMGIFWSTPIIKSSGREQMILLLTGTTLCFLLTIFFILKPSIPICLFQRVGTWFCLSLILSALFVKLVRIARIFLREQTSGRPKFITPIYQIIFTFMLVGGQMLLVLISLIIVYPDSTTKLVLNSENTNDSPQLIITCASPHIALIALQMLYFSVILIVSNALAILTIRFPANFNEVKYVAFSTFCIGIIWIAFLVTYFATTDEFQTAVISLAIQMSALAVLISIFGPRIFIATVWPSKNTAVSISTQGHNVTLSSIASGSGNNKTGNTTSSGKCESDEFKTRQSEN